ncbi:MAG TPA: SRPBCC family protein [Nitrososphaeraceae archaeon]|nr:SRPBCC family protein [Nitrososphaeraceae archaeon]
MRTFRHSFIVNSPIERVWHFYTDVRHLEIITPKEMDLKIIKTTSENIAQGQEIWVSGKVFEAMKIRRAVTWHSKIAFLKKYEYIDEMLEGPFKKWRHLHEFHDIIDGKQTEIIDDVEFELPYGILGKLFEGYAYKQLQNTFEYRKIATVKALE